MSSTVRAPLIFAAMVPPSCSPFTTRTAGNLPVERCGNVAGLAAFDGNRFAEKA